MKTHKFLFLIFAMFVSVYAQAASQALTGDSVISMVQLAMVPAMKKLTTTAIAWLGIFAALQFMITNIGLLKNGGDIDSVIAKLIGCIVWVSFCYYIMTNGPEFIAKVGDQFFNLLGVQLPSASDIFGKTIILAVKMSVVAIAGAAIPMVGNTLGPFIIYIMIFNFAVGILFAFKIFMVQIELGLVAMLSPLSFSFLGLNALKDQGIAPFKALISLGYRIILMTVIMSAYSKVDDVVGAAFGNLKATELSNGIGDIMTTLLSAAGAYMMLAYLLFKSDSIAASLAGGSTNMGTGDIAAAAAAGAAAGAVVASGGASVAASAGSVPQSMGDFMKGMGGGSGSISNASGIGNGQTPAAAPSRPSLSTSGASTGSSSAGKGNAPVRPGGSGAPSSESSGSAPSSSGSTDVGSNGEQTEASAKSAETAANANSGPDSSSPTASGGAPVRPSSGIKAEIGDGNTNVPSQQSQPISPFFNAVKELNRHISEEKASTHISINTHNSD